MTARPTTASEALHLLCPYGDDHGADAHHAQVDVLRDAGWLLVPADDLSAAWAEAEAALWEGWAIYDLHGLRRIDRHRVIWQAVARRSGQAISGEGDTPAAALRALAAKLREIP